MGLQPVPTGPDRDFSFLRGTGAMLGFYGEEAGHLPISERSVPLFCDDAKAEGSKGESSVDRKVKSPDVLRGSLYAHCNSWPPVRRLLQGKRNNAVHLQGLYIRPTQPSDVTPQSPPIPPSNRIGSGG